MKKLLFPAAFCLASLLALGQTPISRHIIGQNANLTDTVGTNPNAGGKLDLFWQTSGPNAGQNHIANSRTAIMRYGGIQVENECMIDGLLNNNPASNLDKTIHDYVRKATVMYQNGIVPMLTMPLKVNAQSGPLISVPLAAKQVKLLVQAVNTQLINDGVPPVQHWIYSNEPENGGNLHNYDGTNAAQQIHDYIKAYHDSVMTIWNTSAWGAPVFVGPELYSFDNYDHSNPIGSGNKVTRLIEQLCGRYNQLGGQSNAFDIRPYINVFSWHMYPFNDESDVTNGNGTIPRPNRSNVIKYLQFSPPATNNQFNITPLAQSIDSLRSWLNNSNIQLAITEANICHINDVNSVNGADDLVTGVGANSFIAGQFWAELMEICMRKNVKILNFWSAVEGTGADGYKTNVGFINSDPNRWNGLGSKKSTYHHYTMLANSMWGNYYRGASSVTPYVKTFSSVESAGFYVIIMNQDSVNNYNFSISFDSTNAGSAPLKLKYNFANAGLQLTNNLWVSDTTIKARSTVLLQFDCHGNKLLRKEYTEAQAIGGTGPYITQIGNQNVDYNLALCSQSSGIGGSVTTNTTYTNDTLYVASDITVSNSATLTFDHCVLVFEPGVKIEGMNRTSIIIRNSILFGCEGSAWEGIVMNGSYNGETVTIDSTYIVGADHPVATSQTPNITLSSSIYVNGDVAVDLGKSQGFAVVGNVFAGFSHGLVTHGTQNGYTSRIEGNRFLDINTDVEFSGDYHTDLYITCNEFRFKDEGIKSDSTDLKDQGDSLQGAGNFFVKEAYGLPEDYINHTGSATTYYFGPAEGNFYNMPNVMNIPLVSSAADQLCVLPFVTNCPTQWLAVEEATQPAVNGLLVYPNPSTGAFSVSFNEPMKTDCLLYVHNAIGQLVTAIQVPAGSSTASFVIQAKGLYLVSMQTKEGIIAQRIVVE